MAPVGSGERSSVDSESLRELERCVAIRTAEFEATFEASTVAIAYLDHDFVFIRVNRNYARADGREPGFYVGKRHFELFPDADNQRLFEQVRATKRPYTVLAKPFEYAHNPERGVSHWDWTLTPVIDEFGVVTGLVLVLVDVTERVAAIEALQEKEKRIAEQLEEKEALLREIHHRVKNNLQVVSSLLYLQSTRADDPSLAQCLAQSRGRIRAMSLVHEVLYESTDLARVGFGRYLRELVASIVSAHHRERPQVRVEVVTDGDEPMLDVSTATPCGLIVCELLSNAFAHAFVGRAQGRATVRMRAGEGRHWLIEVSDDGVGLAKEAHEARTGLGLRLVESLVAQIEGQMTIRLEAGTHFQIELPR